MKRLYALFSLAGLFLLSACSVEIVPDTAVQVTPASATVGTGDTQPFTAALNTDTAEDFTWTLSTGSGQLSGLRGTNVTYTAPETVGEYTMTVSALGVEAKNAVVNISVLKKFLATTEPETVVNSNAADQTILAGETKRFIVNVPSELSEALLYFELGDAAIGNPDPTTPATNTGLTLTVKDEAQNVIAVSSGPTSFSRAGSAALKDSLEAQSITTSLQCRGACTILRNDGATRYFLEVTATTDANYLLYAFDDVSTDSLEPNDNTCTSATTLPNATFEGAIETLGDRDCFVTTVNSPSITLAAKATTAIPIQAEIRAAANDELLTTIAVTPGGANQVYTISPARPVKVIITSPDQAGPSGSSAYDLNIVLN
ncbi:MAG: hypothetical protein ACRCYY_08645 [Trueperaceae bacterium]